MQLTACLLFLLPLLPSPAQENEKWQRLYTWETSAVDINTSNIVFGTDFTGRVRIRFTLSKPEMVRAKASIKYKSVIETIEFKCKEKQYRILKVERFDSKEDVVDTEEAQSPTEWKAAKPRTMFPSYFEPACEVIYEKRRKP
jgi:predicted fused transcriptional regulator/phosphomethylpyrimidine kinase